MIRTPLPMMCLSLALLMPLSALADDHCTHSAPRQLKLDLQGAKAVVFEVASHELVLNARPGAAGELSGRACAAEAEWLEQLTVTQRRQGDKLVVSLAREQGHRGWFSGDHAHMRMSGTLPDTMPVQIKVGSGEAEIDGAPLVSVDVGSGEARVKRTRGLVAADVGSGEIDIENAGALKVIGVNSGDVSARDVRGEVSVGRVGSGEFDLVGARGPVRIGAIGSGAADVSRIDSDVEVESIGSGQVEARDIRGNLTVKSIGSGSADHSGIGGQVRLPAEH